MNNEEYWYWLCSIKNIWNGTIKSLLEIFDSPKEIFESTEMDLIRRLNNGKFKNYMGVVHNILDCRDENIICSNYNELKKKGIKFISIENEKYPEKLKTIENYPYGIYIRGNEDSLKKTSVAIIGARNCSVYGKKMAEKIGFELGTKGINIISGLARGIDTAGLWGSINANGYTSAVLGCGVDICYPRENIELYELMQEKGVILSDYQLGTKPLGWQFPLRNRLISALSDIILVVEAKERSGSLITVEYALEQGKNVCAVPGRIGDLLSEGCNRLIKEGAGMILSPEDILEELGIDNITKTKNFEKNNIVLEKEIETLYSYVDFSPKNIEQLMNESGMNSVQVLRGLIKLQMMNYIEEPLKNYYSRKT